MLYCRCATILLGAILLLGCAPSSGEGELTGSVTVPECELAETAWVLPLTFFASEVVLDDQLEVRLQEGSDLIGKSDGLIIWVRSTERAREQLGTPQPLGGDEADYRATLYLNASCPVNRTDEPVHLEAVVGDITFQNIYAPSVSDEVETEATLTGLQLGEGERSATLSGQFQFLHTRGRPAQRYP